MPDCCWLDGWRPPPCRSTSGQKNSNRPRNQGPRQPLTVDCGSARLADQYTTPPKHAMKQVWLKTNRRALAFALALPLALVALGATWIALVDALFVRVIAGAVVGIGLFAIAGLLLLISQPRLAYRHGELLVYLRM